MAKRRKLRHAPHGSPAAARRTAAKPPKRAATSSRQPTATSLHIGLNAVSPATTRAGAARSSACEFDAKDMAALAKSTGHEADDAADQERRAPRRSLRSAQPPSSSNPAICSSSATRATADRCPTSTAKRTTSSTKPGASTTAQLIDDELYLELSAVRRRRAHPRAVRQLPQRHGDARARCRRRGRRRPGARR